MNARILSGRYNVLQSLRAGGMGETFIAQDMQLPGNPTCVVKQLRLAPEDAAFLSTAQRLFTKEAETLQKLGTHDQIPRLLAYFDEENEFYLVQDYIEGHPLSDEILLGQRWAEADVIQLLKEILEVLTFVHQQQVIHRDIKPDNIIRRKSDGKLVLIDFGAVKSIESRITGMGAQANKTVAIGTPAYMPSEQMNGSPRMSSDLYAVGKIAIQALTGLLPEQLRKDRDDELVWRDQAEVSEGLAGFLTKMVRDYHKHRYQSSAEALEALRLLGDRSSQSSPSVAQFSTGSEVASTVANEEAALTVSGLKGQETTATVVVSPAAGTVGLAETVKTVNRPKAPRKKALLLLIMVPIVAFVSGAIAYQYQRVKSGERLADERVVPVQEEQMGGGEAGRDGAVDPKGEAETESNPFTKADFPQESCGDAQVTRPFYRVYVREASALAKIKQQYCKDAYVETKTNRVKIASFDTKEQAELFQEFIERDVGAVDVDAVTN